MSRNGSGVYTPPLNSWNPPINGAQALPADWKAILDDLTAALTASVAADGQTPITGILNLQNNRLSNVGAPIGQGNALRFDQMQKGTNIASAATITIPIEGNLFEVTGTTGITTINDTFPGRMAWLYFQDAVPLTNSANLMLPGGKNGTTAAGDILCAINTATGIWVVVSWYNSRNDAVWQSKAIGEVFPLMFDTTAVPAPPTDNPHFRFIRLTAGDSYNSGVLSNESVSGSDPTITATAVISLTGSPLYGTTIRLLNTERRFIRPGTSGTLEDSANLSHSHGASAASAGDHAHNGTTSTAGSHAHTIPNTNIGQAGGGSLILGSTDVSYTGNAGDHSHGFSTNTTGSHTHTVTVNSAGGSESRPRAYGLPYYMRIL